MAERHVKNEQNSSEMLCGGAEDLNLIDTHLWTDSVMDTLVEESGVMSSTIHHQSEPKQNKTQNTTSKQR